MNSPKPITLSTQDHAALSLKLAQVLPLNPRPDSNWCRLHEELRRATILPTPLVASTTVQIGSRFTVCDHDNNDEDTYTLVWPEQADITQNRLSVFTPLGTAVIGFSQGDDITWKMPDGIRHLVLTAVQAPARNTAELVK